MAHDDVLRVNIPKAEPVMKIAFYCFGKIANRLPEAMWLTFQPDGTESKNWTMEKSDYQLSPLSVVKGRQPAHARFIERARV